MVPKDVHTLRAIMEDGMKGFSTSMSTISYYLDLFWWIAWTGEEGCKESWWILCSGRDYMNVRVCMYVCERERDRDTRCMTQRIRKLMYIDKGERLNYFTRREEGALYSHPLSSLSTRLWRVSCGSKWRQKTENREYAGLMEAWSHAQYAGEREREWEREKTENSIQKL